MVRTLVEGGAVTKASDKSAIEDNLIPAERKTSSSNYDALKLKHAKNDVDKLSNVLLELYTEEAKDRAAEQLSTCATIYEAVILNGADELLALESYAASLKCLVDEKIIIVKLEREEAKSLKIIKTEINYFLTALNSSAMFDKLDTGVKAVINEATAAVKVKETPLSELSSLRAALESVFVDAQAILTKEWTRSPPQIPSEGVIPAENFLNGKSLKSNQSKIFGKVTKLFSSSKTSPPGSPKSPVSATSKFYAGLEVKLPTATTPVNVIAEKFLPSSPTIESTEPIYATVARRHPPSAPKAVEATDL
ncbi:hypothetical protein [Glaciimonas sp. PCH181]|uniref:hypothetical protein n=1 Tax=Glaciimonas sp. PCH181 TaxID=2133943 RepID=UPI0011B21E49|nr:hypothetical protein [Glaciimonas sp. PCH181]